MEGAHRLRNMRSEFEERSSRGGVGYTQWVFTLSKDAALSLDSLRRVTRLICDSLEFNRRAVPCFRGYVRKEIMPDRGGARLEDKSESGTSERERKGQRLRERQGMRERGILTVALTLALRVGEETAEELQLEISTDIVDEKRGRGKGGEDRAAGGRGLIVSMAFGDGYID